MQRDFELFGLRGVLAEPCQDGVDPVLLLFFRRLMRLDQLARHEPGDRPPDEAHLVTRSRSHALVDAASSVFSSRSF
jgi:hypothetical protein